jgi:hypothetical protein
VVLKELICIDHVRITLNTVSTNVIIQLNKLAQMEHMHAGHAKLWKSKLQIPEFLPAHCVIVLEHLIDTFFN